jgi:hypothetical protein
MSIAKACDVDEIPISCSFYPANEDHKNDILTVEESVEKKDISLPNKVGWTPFGGNCEYCSWNPQYGDKSLCFQNNFTETSEP